MIVRVNEPHIFRAVMDARWHTHIILYEQLELGLLGSQQHNT